MTHQYSNQTMAPNLEGLTPQVHIELLDGHQWRKGSSTLVVGSMASADDVRRFIKTKASIKCPKNRGLTSEIMDALLTRAVVMKAGTEVNSGRHGWKEELLGNGVKQQRLTTSKYRISWYMPS